jgi:hypothetical protein
MSHEYSQKLKIKNAHATCIFRRNRRNNVTTLIYKEKFVTSLFFIDVTDVTKNRPTELDCSRARHGETLRLDELKADRGAI